MPLRFSNSSINQQHRNAAPYLVAFSTFFKIGGNLLLKRTRFRLISKFDRFIVHELTRIKETNIDKLTSGV